MMNSQGWPAVLPHHPFWSTTFARDLRWGGICFVREVIALVFALWKRKEENEKELDVITRPPHPSRCCWALHLLTKPRATDSSPANSRSWSPSISVSLPLLCLLQKTHTSQTVIVCPEGLSWAPLQRQGQVTL